MEKKKKSPAKLMKEKDKSGYKVTGMKKGTALYILQK